MRTPIARNPAAVPDIHASYTHATLDRLYENCQKVSTMGRANRLTSGSFSLFYLVLWFRPPKIWERRSIDKNTEH